MVFDKYKAFLAEFLKIINGDEHRAIDVYQPTMVGAGFAEI